MGTLPSEAIDLALWAYALDLPAAWDIWHSVSRSDRSKDEELAADSEAIFCSACARMSRAILSFRKPAQAFKSENDGKLAYELRTNFWSIAMSRCRCPNK